MHSLNQCKCKRLLIIGGKMKKAVALVLLGLLITVSSAGVLTQKITFNPNSISVTKEHGFDRLSMALSPLTAQIGAPSLPIELRQIVIPCNATVTNIEVISKNENVLAGTFDILPAQTPRSYSPYEPEPAFVDPDPGIYGSSEIYPRELVVCGSTETKSGFRLGGVNIYPLRYIPAERKLVFCSELTLRIHYQEGTFPPVRRGERQLARAISDLQTMVSNPEDIERFAPPVSNASFGSPYLPPGNYEHVIITPYVGKDTLQKLADWRTKKGMPSRVVCVESLMTYPGRDTAEKMRNFIKDADTTWHTDFFFIARRDYPSLQFRRLCPTGTTVFPGDMYFSCLNGTYNADNDTFWGEYPSDSVDFLSDVFVGMITLDGTNWGTEASRYLSKLFRYEKSADTTYFNRALIFWNAGPAGYPDSVANVTPAGWVDAKIYSAAATAQALTDSLNRGYGYFSAQAHGMTDAICTSPYWYSTNSIALTNTNRLNVCITVCCDVAGWDRTGTTNGDCIAENMSVHSANGFVANIMNTRSGWMNVAELFNYMFFWKFLPKDGTARCSAYVYVGQALARVKDQFRTMYPTSSYWRYEAYERTLFGDPAIPLHNTSGVVRHFTVVHPASISPGIQNFTVAVNVNDYAPVESVLVCLWKGAEVYARGYTNTSGSVTLSINPRTMGPMSVTCSKRNYLPYEGNCTVMVGVAEEKQPVVPHYFALGRSQPNPFGEWTSMKYQLARQVRTRLAIYDATGRLVRNLVSKTEPAGWYSVTWDGKNDRGLECAAGIYFYRLEAGGFTATKNLVIVR